jgi:hypothetical protein
MSSEAKAAALILLYRLPRPARCRRLRRRHLPAIVIAIAVQKGLVILQPK